MSRRILLLALWAIIPLVSFSCLKKPDVAFTIQPEINPEAGDELQFVNNTLNAKRYYWDFGNGKTSEEESPFVIFEKPGDYNVTLVAEGSLRTDSLTQSFLINPPTVLEIYCYQRNLEPLNSGHVRVWKTLANAQRDRQPLLSKIADKNGMVSFQNLEATTYFVYIQKPVEGGEYAGGGDVGPLVINEINSYAAVVDFQFVKKSTSSEATDYHCNLNIQSRE
jgi:PKD repeat protein